MDHGWLLEQVDLWINVLEICMMCMVIPVPRELLQGDARTLDRRISRLPIDHAVGPVDVRGGAAAGAAVLRRFLRRRLERYEQRNQPEANVTSGLSPYLHFGHVSSHAVFQSLVRSEGWHPGQLSRKASGQRAGWWNMV